MLQMRGNIFILCMTIQISLKPLLGHNKLPALVCSARGPVKTCRMEYFVRKITTKFIVSDLFANYSFEIN